jgi:hypothetical protein
MRRTALKAIAVVLAPLIAPLSLWIASRRSDSQPFRVQSAAAAPLGVAGQPRSVASPPHFPGLSAPKVVTPAHAAPVTVAIRPPVIAPPAPKPPTTHKPPTTPVLSAATRTFLMAASRSANRYRIPAAPPRAAVQRSRPAATKTRTAPAPASSGSSGGAWACIRSRESGGNYRASTGNGYYGAYQFSDATWHSVGGSGHASNASPAEQDMRARMLQARSGWGQWSTAAACGV